MDVFAENYHVIFVDMLEHGKSQVRDGNIGIDATVNLVTEIFAKDWKKREPNAQLQIIPNACQCAKTDMAIL